MTTAKMEREPGVGFLGVGPEKTGTTWLHEMLSTHPQLGLPPYKELSFFWQDRDFPRETVFDRFTKDSWHHKRYRRYAFNRLKSAVRNPRYTFRNRNRVVWDLNYLLKTHDEDWYLSLFDFDPEKIAGEISPQYFFLGQEQVEKVRRVCPDARIIITLREPRAWIWSWVRMMVKKEGYDPLGPEAVKFVDGKIASASFSKALKTWRSVYPEDQVDVFFYEDLCNEPWELYERICAFLAIKPEAQVRERVHKRVNAGNTIDIPANLRQRIEDGWRDDVRELEQLLGRLPEEWKAPAEQD